VLALSVIALASAPIARADDTKSFEVYGFAHFDYIQDFNRVNPDWAATLRPSKIPTVDGLYGSDGQAVLSARQSRLGAKANFPTDNGAVFAKFEFDMYGVGADAGLTTIRLRHAYGEWGNWLGGQTNTLFMDASVFPNVIDYWGPNGMAFIRNPQLRFTTTSDSRTFALALEHPGNDVDAGELRNIDPSLANTVSHSMLPDLTAQMRFERGWGHLQIAGVLRRVGYETLGGPNSSPKGYRAAGGVDVTSNIKFRERDVLHLGVVAGKGIANYMNDGGTDLAADGTLARPEAAPLPLLGTIAYLDHYWNDRFSSSLGYSRTQVDNADLQTADAYKSGQYASVNLLYYPTQKVYFGGELLWGRRDDNGGANGEDFRFQLSAHYDFSSAD
jgi:hypothetical protein